MITNASKTFSRLGRAPEALDKDRLRSWFALTLPAVMAFLLVLVSLMGTGAIIPILFVLIPLVFCSAFYDSERALYVYIAWCWLDGIIRGLFHSDPLSIVARDIVMGVIVIGWGLQRLQNRSADPVRYPPGSVLVALFIINCLLQIFNPYSLGLVSSIAGLKLHLAAIPLLFVAYDTIRRREQVRALFLFLTLATLVIGILSFAQYTEGRDWTYAHFPGTKDVISQSLHATRVGGSITEAASFKPPGATGFGGGTGTFIGLIFPLTFALLMLTEKFGFSKRAKAALLGIVLAFIVFIFVNGVRSALVMAIVGVLISGILIGGRLRVRALALCAVCLVLGMVAWTYSQALSQGGVTDRFSSTFSDPVDALHKDRHTFFDDVADIAVHSPMGIGLGRVGPAAARLGSGNNDLGFVVFSESYLGNMMYETGIIGGILIACITLTFIVRGYLATLRLRDPDDKFLATAILAVLAIIFGNFFVSPILLGPPGSVLFWLLSGVLLRVYALTPPSVTQRSVSSKGIQ